MPNPVTDATPTPTPTSDDAGALNGRQSDSAPVSIYVTYFSLYDGVVWPQCANQANWDEYGKCLRRGTDLRNLYNNFGSEVTRVADVTAYPCNTDWAYLWDEFHSTIDDYPHDYKVQDYFAEHCGLESYRLVEGESSDLPPKPTLLADVVRDDIAVALGFDSWADYDVAYELVHVDGCLMNRNDLDVEALIATLELIGGRGWIATRSPWMPR